MGIFSEGVEVKCAPGGQPLNLLWAGRRYTVCAEPVRWFERRQWWAEEKRAPLGAGKGLVDHEIWRIQVKAEDRRAPGVSQEPLTLDLSRDIGSGRWRLLRIHDALQTKTAPKTA